MTNEPRPGTASSDAARFILYMATVVTVVMVLFPPFNSLNGTEYAFVLTGPTWSQRMGALGNGLGLTARVHWILLLVQLSAVWAIAIGGKRILGGRSANWPTTVMLACVTSSTQLEVSL